VRDGLAFQAAGVVVVEVGTGVLSLRTAQATTTDSIFQIGSVTKVFTSVLAMQLFDEGRLDLDAAVCDYLPGFRTADPVASRAITVRQLLSHTAGFMGDVFADTGSGDNAVSLLVELLADVDQDFAPGELFSYNNAAFVVMGRIIEVLRAKPFDVVLRERILGPLALGTSATSAAEAILGRPAVGHLPALSAGPLEPAPVWSLPRSGAPAGATLSMSAGDLVRFGQMFLRGGTTEDGSIVVSSAAVKRMREKVVGCPDLGRAPGSRGLGWGIYDFPTGPMLGHDGGTVGQYAYLRLVPGRDVVVALLANGGDAASIRRAVVDAVLHELAGVPLESLPVPTASPVSFDRYVGTYRSGLLTLTVTADAGRLRVRAAPTPILAGLRVEAEDFELLPVGRAQLFARQDDLHQRMAFIGEDDTGRARFLHTGRAHARVGG
jgi:CubicO group peptidase (beta-lactamase class C family)